MRTLLLAGWVLAGQPGLSQQAAPPPQAPPTQQTPPSQEVRRVLDGLPTAVAAQFGVTLTLAAPVTRTDGRVSGASMRNLSQPFAYFVYSNGDLCGATTLTTVEPRAAMVGWRVTATSVTRTATQLVVKLDWQRLWDRGRALPNGPRGSTELVLQREDRVPVDFVAAPPADGCDATGIGLEVAAERRLVSSGAPDAAAGRDLDAELWLVHRRPDGVENVQRLEIHAGQAGMGFFFRPTRVETTTATLMIEVAGDIRPSTSQNGPALAIAIERVWLSAEPGAAPLRGGSARTIPLPAAGEVISFDLPSGGARGGGGGGRGAGVAGGGAARGGGGASAGSVAGGGGSGGGRGGAGAAAADRPAAVATGLVTPDPLNGHTFSLRLRLK